MRLLGQNRTPLLRRGLNIRLSIKRTMSTIDHERAENRFTTVVDGHAARLDYTLSGRVMNITHTRVPPEIGGRGVAADLMRAALDTANAEGWDVNPVCSYAVAYMRKHHLPTERDHVEDLLDEALDESFPASDSPSVGGSN
jgi:predicted GNAT family acetyltransferase